jgi:DNA-binding MarR family transcriptional regulator
LSLLDANKNWCQQSRANKMKRDDASRALLSEAQELGHENRAGTNDHAALKLWLRMLASTTQIESQIRKRLRERFNISLARFDYMAQLFRYNGGLKMRVLSRYLMVTGGNVTGLTDELEREGLVVREGSPDDRRAWIVRLTPKGRRSFEAMAQEHEQWVLELFAGLDAKAVQQLYAHLGALRVQLMQQDQVSEEKA